MRFVLMLMLAASLLALSGCTSKEGLPNQNATNQSPENNTPPVVANTPPVVPPQNLPGNSGIGGGQPQNTPANGTVSGIGNTEGSIVPMDTCGALNGSAKVECAFAKARDYKNVSLCATSLYLKDDIFKCITQWCASEARDFNQCEQLTGDNRLGCLNKCNPNPNT
jgi:hypothetical protein